MIWFKQTVKIKRHLQYIHRLKFNVMKKSFNFLLLCMIAFVNANGQDNVGIGTLTPHPSAILDLTAATQGFLVPRTDTALVVNPADGLLIYQTTDKNFYYYDIAVPAWKSFGNSYIAGTGITITGNVISATNDNDWLFNGNHIYNGNAGNVGVGTNSPAVSFHVGTNDAIGIPAGNTAQRPAAAPSGATRYNSDLGVLEFFNGTVWLNVNTPPIGATYIQWFEAARPNTIYPNTQWIETDIIDGSFIRARGGFANVANGGALSGVTQTDGIVDHQHSGSGTTTGSGILTTSSDGAHMHNWGGWWSVDDSREWINGNGDGVNGNTLSDNVFWWGGNPATVGAYSQGEYSNVNWVIDAAGNHNHGGATGGYNDIGSGCGNPKYVPYDDNTQSSTVSSSNNAISLSCPWNGNATVGNFLGRLGEELNHNHVIAADGNHAHNIRLYAHRHWLKERPTSLSAVHSHTVPDHTHGLSLTIGSPTFPTGGNVANENRPMNEAVIFWRRIN
jgi:hypothetical protein